jgi:hypothetical protein
MNTKRHLSFSAATIKGCVLATVTGLMLAACQSAPAVDPKVINAAKSANAVLFTAATKTSGATEASIVAVLNNGLAAGHSSGNMAKVSSALASGFEKRSLSGADEMVVQDTNALLDAIKKNPAKLTYAVQSVKVAGDKKSAAVVALATYESENFSPKFLESLIFTNQGGDWKLASQSAAPLHPSLPQLHQATLIVTEQFWSDSEAKSISDIYIKMAQKKGPEAALDYIKSNIKARTGAGVHALAIFREPPKIGSSIKIGADFHHNGRTYPYTQSQTINNTYRNYVLGMETLAHPKADDIGFQIYVDGVLVLKEMSKGQ